MLKNKINQTKPNPNPSKSVPLFKFCLPENRNIRLSDKFVNFSNAIFTIEFYSFSYLYSSSTTFVYCYILLTDILKLLVNNRIRTNLSDNLIENVKYVTRRYLSQL